MEIDTENQKIAIEHIEFYLDSAIQELTNKKEEIEGSNNESEKLDVIEMRLDSLAKIKKHLIEPVWSAYRFIEEGNEIMQMGDIGSIIEDTKNKFTQSMLQGL